LEGCSIPNNDDDGSPSGASVVNGGSVVDDSKGGTSDVAGGNTAKAGARRPTLPSAGSETCNAGNTIGAATLTFGLCCMGDGPVNSVVGVRSAGVVVFGSPGCVGELADLVCRGLRLQSRGATITLSEPTEGIRFGVVRRKQCHKESLHPPLFRCARCEASQTNCSSQNVGFSSSSTYTHMCVCVLCTTRNREGAG